MGLLDNIGKTNISHKKLGRLISSSPVVEHLLPEEYLEIRERSVYRTWFSINISSEVFRENDCLNLWDVLMNIGCITRMSPIYVVDNTLLTMVTVGINSDVRLVKDAVKFVWSVACAMWGSFRDTFPTVYVGWMSEYIQRGRNFLVYQVDFDEFLKGFDNFHTNLDHNNLDDSNKDKSVLWHLVGRLISHKEAEKMVSWCRRFWQIKIKSAGSPKIYARKI